MNENEEKLRVIAEDCKAVIEEAKSMGCNKVRALYNIPLENMELIVQALEKQIPRKPVNYDKHYYKCPCCNEDLEIDDDMLFVYDEEPPKFCIKCGQKLDLGNEE